MECRGSYGSKIQTLVRHLLHIQNVDPGAKSIVFSAWADSLQSEDRFRWMMVVWLTFGIIHNAVIEHALTFNGESLLRWERSPLALIRHVRDTLLTDRPGKRQGRGQEIPYEARSASTALAWVRGPCCRSVRS